MLILVANRSIVGENPNSPHMKWNTDSFNFHSVCISYFRDSKSVSVFCIPGKCVADNHIEELETHCHISFVTKSHYCDLLVPNVFIHVAAVEFSVNTLIWMFVRPFAKAFKPNKIAFSSSTLIFSFISDVENRLPVELESITAPQP